MLCILVPMEGSDWIAWSTNGGHGTLIEFPAPRFGQVKTAWEKSTAEE